MADPMIEAGAAVYARLAGDAILTNTGGVPSVTIEQVRVGNDGSILGEIKRVTVDATGGTYTLACPSLWAPAPTLAWDANAAAVHAAIDANWTYDAYMDVRTDPDRFNSYFVEFVYDGDAFQAINPMSAGIGNLVKAAPLAPGGVWSIRAPVDVASYPLVTFALLPGRTDYTLAGPYRHVFDLRVTVLDKSEDVGPSGAVMDRIAALLQDVDDTGLVMTSYDVLYCRRQTTNQMSPIREGDQFQQLIHGYRLEVKPI